MIDLPLNDFPSVPWRERWERSGGPACMLGRVRRIQLAQDFIDDYLPTVAVGDRILWVGCSWGEALEILKAKEAEPVGVELNPAQNASIPLSLHWERQQLNVFFSDGTDFIRAGLRLDYDGIVLYGYSALMHDHIHHMNWQLSDGLLSRQTRRLLAGCCSMLNKNGWLVLRLPFCENSDGYAEMVVKHMTGLDFHPALITPVVHRWERREVANISQPLADSVSNGPDADTRPFLPSLPEGGESETPDSAELQPVEGKTADPPFS